MLLLLLLLLILLMLLLMLLLLLLLLQLHFFRNYDFLSFAAEIPSSYIIRFIFPEYRHSAPAGVTDLKVSDSSVRKEITWTNPTSSCFVETAVSVNYGGYYDYTLTPAGTSISVPLCNKGTGLVRVRAKGGDGESIAASATLARWTGEGT